MNFCEKSSFIRSYVIADSYRSHNRFYIQLILRVCFSTVFKFLLLDFNANIRCLSVCRTHAYTLRHYEDILFYFYFLIKFRTHFLIGKTVTTKTDLIYSFSFHKRLTRKKCEKKTKNFDFRCHLSHIEKINSQ